MASPFESLVGMEAEMPEGPMPPQVLIPPQGFTPPPEAVDGKSFDAVVRMKLEGGELVVESINGMPFDEMEEMEPEVEQITGDVEKVSLDGAMRASGVSI
jgi:hypothetical protein